MSLATHEWINHIAKGCTFADIGGLGFEAAHETVSVALEAGATEATMVDIPPLDHELWRQFSNRCQLKGLTSYRMLQGDINAPGNIGPFDIVHFSGVIYHMPNPVHTMLHVRALCARYLILSSMFVPSVMHGPDGDVTLGEGMTIFVPAIAGRTKAICAAHLDSLDLKVLGINAPEPFDWLWDDSSPNYGPWWWLFTQDYLERLLQLAGFRISAKQETWAARSVSFLCERV